MTCSCREPASVISSVLPPGYRATCCGLAPVGTVPWRALADHVQRDGGARQGLADRAEVLGILRDLGELLGRNTVRRSADRQHDAADPEAARRVRAERDVGADVKGLPAAPCLAQQR